MDESNRAPQKPDSCQNEADQGPFAGVRSELDSKHTKRKTSDVDNPPTDEDIKNQIRKSKLARFTEDTAQKRDNRQMRKVYARAAYALAVLTIMFWMVFVSYYIRVGVDDPKRVEFISTPIFMSITTACTVNVLFAFHAVIKGLFKNN